MKKTIILGLLILGILIISGCAQQSKQETVTITHSNLALTNLRWDSPGPDCSKAQIYGWNDYPFRYNLELNAPTFKEGYIKFRCMTFINNEKYQEGDYDAHWVGSPILIDRNYAGPGSRGLNLNIYKNHELKVCCYLTNEGKGDNLPISNELCESLVLEKACS